MNLQFVLHWKRLGLAAGQSILAAQATFLDRRGKWLRKKTFLAYLWTIEFSPRKGFQAHLLLAARRFHVRSLAELFCGLPRVHA